MPAKIVDLSARSEIIKDEPFGLHFWECEPKEFLEYLQDPRAFLAGMGIKLPRRCRIETTIENHDWIARNTSNLTQNGGGNVGIARDIYRVISYGHTHESIGKFRKTLLHKPSEQERASGRVKSAKRVSRRRKRR